MNLIDPSCLPLLWVELDDLCDLEPAPLLPGETGGMPSTEEGGVGLVRV